MFHSKFNRVLKTSVSVQHFSRLVKAREVEPLQSRHLQKPRMRVGSSQWQKLQADIVGLQSDLAREKEENLAASAIKCPHCCIQQPDLDSEKRKHGESSENECCNLLSKIDNLQCKLDFERWERREAQENTNIALILFLWFVLYQVNKPGGRR